MKTPRLWIGGKWIEARAKTDCVNPASGELLPHAPLGDRETLESALAAAQQTFPRVRQQAPYERATILQAVARGLEQRRQELAETILAEAGKPITLAEAEV